MLAKIKDWLGFGGIDAFEGHSGKPGRGGHGHAHGDQSAERGSGAGHGHTHGVVNPSIATSERGVWADGPWRIRGVDGVPAG